MWNRLVKQTERTDLPKCPTLTIGQCYKRRIIHGDCDYSYYYGCLPIKIKRGIGYFNNSEEAEQYLLEHNIRVRLHHYFLKSLALAGLGHMTSSKVAPYVDRLNDVLYPLIAKLTPTQLATAGPALAKMGFHLPSFTTLGALILFLPSIVETIIQYHIRVFEEMHGADELKLVRNKRKFLRYIFKQAAHHLYLVGLWAGERAVELGLGYGYYRNSTNINKFLTMLAPFNTTVLTLTVCGFSLVYAMFVLAKGGGQTLYRFFRYVIANVKVWKKMLRLSPRTRVPNYHASQLTPDQAKKFNRKSKKKLKAAAKKAHKDERKIKEPARTKMVERDGHVVKRIRKGSTSTNKLESIQKRRKGSTSTNKVKRIQERRKGSDLLKRIEERRKISTGKK